MRVTNKLLSNNFLTDMQRNLTNLSKIQTQMSSMKNFSKPSDDPINVQRAMQLQTSIDYNAQYAVNIKAAQGWMQTTDTALTQINTVLTKIRNNLEKGGGDGGYTQDERDKINDEVNQEVSQIAQLLNTNFKGEYVFGGTAGLSKPVSTSTYDITRSATDVYKDCVKIDYSDKDGNTVNYLPDVVSDGFDINNWISSIDSTVDSTGITKSVSDLPSNVKFTVDGTTYNLDLSSLDLSGATAAADVINTLDADTTGLKDKIEIDDNGDGTVTFKAKNIDDSIKTNIVGKTISFDFNSNTYKIAIDPADSNIDDVVKDLNTQIQNITGLKDKINVVKTNDGNIKFLAVGSDNIKISGTTVVDDLAGAVDKQLSSMDLENIGASKNIEVSQGVVLDYNVTAVDVMKYGSGDNDDIRLLMDRIEHHLAGQVEQTDDDGNIQKDLDGNIIYVNDEEKAKERLINEDLIDIDAASKQVLKVDSQIGAKEKRMDGLSDQNSSSKVDMTDILSKTEDIDITQKTIEYATMITIYQACLQTGGRIIQPTLMDYIS
ncbi:flagellar hook-associated protein FlgL [Clostridium sp. MT-14]|uniref:flagellar hook-associated protein FlgL n=1 Tax=Clostridium sp. MT-14 TaxID=3348360 RepID=UPI0035F4A279